jgi:hypothetical protein
VEEGAKATHNEKVQKGRLRTCEKVEGVFKD